MLESFQGVAPKPENAVFCVFFSSILLAKVKWKQGQDISAKDRRGKGGKTEGEKTVKA